MAQWGMYTDEQTKGSATGLGMSRSKYYDPLSCRFLSREDRFGNPYVGGDDGSSTIFFFQVMSAIPGIGAPFALAMGVEDIREGDYLSGALNIGGALLPFATDAIAVGQGLRLAGEAETALRVAGEAESVLAPAAREAKAIAPVFENGEFSIIDWRGYPEGLERPAGPFRMLHGDEMNLARATANEENRMLHGMFPDLKPYQIHEIHPVKFGGSPISPANKVALDPSHHRQFSAWWYKLQRVLERGKG